MRRLKSIIRVVVVATVAAGAYVMGKRQTAAPRPQTRAERKAARKAAVARALEAKHAVARK